MLAKKQVRSTNQTVRDQVRQTEFNQGSWSKKQVIDREANPPLKVGEKVSSSKETPILRGRMQRSQMIREMRWAYPSILPSRHDSPCFSFRFLVQIVGFWSVIFPPGQQLRRSMHGLPNTNTGEKVNKVETETYFDLINGHLSKCGFTSLPFLSLCVCCPILSFFLSSCVLFFDWFLLRTLVPLFIFLS